MCTLCVPNGLERGRLDPFALCMALPFANSPNYKSRTCYASLSQALSYIETRGLQAPREGGDEVQDAALAVPSIWVTVDAGGHSGPVS